MALRAPLARVPENGMKFVVGVLLTSFGIFWGAEGAGASWPGGEASLAPLVAVVLSRPWRWSPRSAVARHRALDRRAAAEAA